MNKAVVIGFLAILLAGGGGLYLLMNNKPATPESGQSQRAQTSVMPVATGSEMQVLPTGTGVVKEFVVDGSNFVFAPAEMRVKKGDTVKVLFKNAGGMHDFVVDEFNVKTNQLQEGEEEEVEFVVDKVGTFEYYCSVGTHRQMGMVGKLIVE